MRTRFVTIASLPGLLILSGTLGYHLIEGWRFFDSLYMAVITLTTIGFGEVHPMSSAGRAFTMALALLGIFTMFFASTEILRTWASGELRTLLGRQRMEKTMTRVQDHVVVCGYGRMGRLVCHEFSKRGVPFVVVERNEELLADFAVKGGVPLHGDATNDEVLKRAAIDRARALVTVVASDSDNLYITMSARLLNEKLPIVARAEDDSAAKKLSRAGATQIVSPYVIGGGRVAEAVLRPAVLDFIDLATKSEHLELQLEEVQVRAGSKLAGARLDAGRVRSDLNVIIVAVKRAGERMTFNPPDEAKIAQGDTLVMLGPRAKLDELERMARA